VLRLLGGHHVAVLEVFDAGEPGADLQPGCLAFRGVVVRHGVRSNSVESNAATCSVRYSCPDPAASVFSAIVTPHKAAGALRVATPVSQ
jgi:hypothetical protein